MTKRTRWMLLGGAVVVTVAIVALGGWLAWRYGQAAWWGYQASLALDETESAALADCGDPGWIGLLKVLEQDLDTECPSTWFAEQAVLNVKPRHRQRARWLRQVVGTLERPARARFRAGSALLSSGREAPPDLIVVAREADVDPVDLVEGIRAGLWEPSFADPAVRHRVAVFELAPDDPGADERIVRALRHAAVLPVDSAFRAELAELGLDAVGLDRVELDDMLARRGSGRALGMFPPDLVRRVLDGGGARCATEVVTPGCLLWLADAVDELGTPTPSPPAALDGLATLWEVRDDPQPAQVRLRIEEVAAYGAWAGEPEKARTRAARLRAMTLGGEPDVEAWRRGEGSVEAILMTHTGLPWARAVLLQALGELAEVDVRVGTGTGGVWIEVGREVRWLGPCGEVSEVLEEDVRSEAWPARAVLAQLAVEEARLARWRGGDASVRRLVGLAERLDPVGSGGLIETLDADGPGDPVVGAALAAVDDGGVVLSGAEAARRAQSERVKASWAEALACP